MSDRISDLPNNVIDIILSNIPLRDAVQTSILSRNWRLHWTRVHNLVLDDEFSDAVLDGQRGKTFVDIVGNILLSHSGPIRKFALQVPSDGDFPDAINLWILAVSRHGVQDLTLEYKRFNDRTLPSYLFQCMELKQLVLRNIQTCPPHYFREFSALRSLDFYSYLVYGEFVTNLILHCPWLERLSLGYQNIDDAFSINASELKHLCITYRCITKFIMQNTPNLSTVSLKCMGNFTPDTHSDTYFSDIAGFCGAVPKLENLYLTGGVLAEWGVQHVPKKLPAPLENHLSLTVHNCKMYSLAQVCSMVCLIKSSPILQTLDIFLIQPDFTNYPPHVTSDYLKTQREVENLWSLKVVNVAGLMGLEPEIFFIETILSCCPVLEKLILISDSRLRSDAELKMTTDVMRFRRASTQAEILYSKSK